MLAPARRNYKPGGCGLSLERGNLVGTRASLTLETGSRALTSSKRCPCGLTTGKKAGGKAILHTQLGNQNRTNCV